MKIFELLHFLDCKTTKNIINKIIVSEVCLNYFIFRENNDSKLHGNKGQKENREKIVAICKTR